MCNSWQRTIVADKIYCEKDGGDNLDGNIRCVKDFQFYADFRPAIGFSEVSNLDLGNSNNKRRIKQNE